MESSNIRSVANQPGNRWDDPDWISRDYHRLARARYRD
jgi:hypothetical protein